MTDVIFGDSFQDLLMSAEFEDVLTNQPVVIDNVRQSYAIADELLMDRPVGRALVQLRLVLLDKITQNASFLRCELVLLAPDGQIYMLRHVSLMRMAAVSRSGALASR